MSEIPYKIECDDCCDAATWYVNVSFSGASSETHMTCDSHLHCALDNYVLDCPNSLRNIRIVPIHGVANE